MEYPVIDRSLEATLNIRAATGSEERDIKASRPIPDTLYWVKTRHGNVLRGINADGLAKLLSAIGWLDKEEATRVSEELRQLRAAAVTNMEYFIRKHENALYFEAHSQRGTPIHEKATSVSALLRLIRRDMSMPAMKQTPGLPEDNCSDTLSRSRSSRR